MLFPLLFLCVVSLLMCVCVFVLHYLFAGLCFCLRGVPFSIRDDTSAVLQAYLLVGVSFFLVSLFGCSSFYLMTRVLCQSILFSDCVCVCSLAFLF